MSKEYWKIHKKRFVCRMLMIVLFCVLWTGGFALLWFVPDSEYIVLLILLHIICFWIENKIQKKYPKELDS